MTKIEALQKTVYNLENDVYEYSWTGYNTCNCGVLARTLMNGSFPHDNGTFENGANDENGGTCSGFSGVYGMNLRVCSSTGIPLPKVYRVLNETGFTFKELDSLEKASYNKEGVINYFKKWLKELQEKMPNSEPEVQVSVATKADSSTEAGKTKIITKYVSVPSSITEQSKELVLS
jgi:hypothetical protein